MTLIICKEKNYSVLSDGLGFEPIVILGYMVLVTSSFLYKKQI